MALFPNILLIEHRKHRGRYLITKKRSRISYVRVDDVPNPRNEERNRRRSREYSVPVLRMNYLWIPLVGVRERDYLDWTMSRTRSVIVLKSILPLPAFGSSGITTNLLGTAMFGSCSAIFFNVDFSSIG